jgi:hypothetical protein
MRLHSLAVVVAAVASEVDVKGAVLLLSDGCCERRRAAMAAAVVRCADSLVAAVAAAAAAAAAVAAAGLRVAGMSGVGGSSAIVHSHDTGPPQY